MKSADCGCSDSRGWNLNLNSARKIYASSHWEIHRHGFDERPPLQAAGISSTVGFWKVLLIAGGSREVEVFDSGKRKNSWRLWATERTMHFMTETRFGDGSVLLRGGYPK